MASPSTVISLGFGSWGSTGLVLTLGFGAGAQGATIVAPFANVLRLHTGQRLELHTGARLELNTGKRLELHNE